MKHIIIIAACCILFSALGMVAYSQEIQVGTFTITSTIEGYSLNNGSGERTVSVEVTFPKGFEVKPEVVLNLNSVDADKTVNTRISMKPVSISRDGFTIQVKTWADSKINLVGGTWIAVAQKK